ncbi:MAG: chorismate-binding protein, partial [Geminicoccaceae bacterium]|nr:chorismate-binding protein [Geminicoccaceae bacterium]
MGFSPDFADFAAIHAARRPAVVWTTLVADLETPVSAMLKLAYGRPYSLLLESVEGGAVRGRYSIIGLKPDLIWRCKGGRVEINRHARIDLETFEPLAEAPLRSLRRLMADCRIDLPGGLPPMAAGLFGHMTYDMVREAERLPDANPDRLGLPDAVFVRPTLVVVFDNVRDEMTLITPVWPEDGTSARRAFERAQERLSDAVADLGRGILPDTTGRVTGPPPEAASNMSEADYHRMVEKAKGYIRAGDAFQVVPSQRFEVPFSLPPIALYRSLRRLNPSPFLFYLDLKDFTLVGSSPEILVRVRKGVVTIRPIAGTRRRGADAAEDVALAEELLADPKEVAEHLMLLDLGRNDVGRVAAIGSVRVTERMIVERYSHVMH